MTGYLEAAGLMDPLERLGFALAGYGCTTCIGNSGPLDEPVARAVEEHDLVVAAVLSGNRNFEGRIHPLARASYLASPPLVVAFALAGRVDIDLTSEPLGIGDDGRPVFLADVWPSSGRDPLGHRRVDLADLFRATYATVFEGDDRWRALPIPDGDRYAWDPASTYIARPPFLDGVPAEPAAGRRHRRGARPGRPRRLGHHRPHLAGRLDRRLVARRAVAPGARRRAARVQLVRRPARPARGDDPRHVRQHPAAQPARRGQGGPVHASTCPTASETFIYDAAMRYAAEGVPLIVLAGREYGSGSSRDWAAKGPALLGVRAVLAESYERIHRSNLVGMGVLPLQFPPGRDARPRSA